MSGRIEGYQSDLGAKVGGRVVWIAVREGADVRKGRLLVQIDDAQARAQAAASAAAVIAAFLLLTGISSIYITATPNYA